MTKFLANVFTGLIVTASIATGGSAAYKLASATHAAAQQRGAPAIEAVVATELAGGEDEPSGRGTRVEAAVAGDTEMSADNAVESERTAEVALAVAGNATTQTQQNQNMNSTSASATVFTAATLASHSRSGDCYIAISGTVYDVSNSASWANCRHVNGAQGGRDFTASFPHPASYLTGLPVVGTYSTTVIAANTNTGVANQNGTIRAPAQTEQWTKSEKGSRGDNDWEDERDDD